MPRDDCLLCVAEMDPCPRQSVSGWASATFAAEGSCDRHSNCRRSSGSVADSGL